MITMFLLYILQMVVFACPKQTSIEYFQMYPKQKVIKKEEFITANIHQSEQCSF